MWQEHLLFKSPVPQVSIINPDNTIILTEKVFLFSFPTLLQSLHQQPQGSGTLRLQIITIWIICNIENPIDLIFYHDHYRNYILNHLYLEVG